MLKSCSYLRTRSKGETVCKILCSFHAESASFLDRICFPVRKEFFMARNSKKRSNGEGTIYYEESRKRWVAEIAWQDRLGETHKKRFTAQKQVAAKTKLNEFKRQLLICAAAPRNFPIALIQPNASICPTALPRFCLRWISLTPG